MFNPYQDRDPDSRGDGDDGDRGVSRLAAVILAVIVVTSVVGVGAMVVSMSQPASGEPTVQSVDFQMSDAETTVAPGETITEFAVTVDVTAEYDGLEGEQKDVSAAVFIRGPDGNWEIIDSASVTPDQSSGTATLTITGDVLADTSYTREDFMPNDSGSLDRQFEMKVEVSVFSNDPAWKEASGDKASATDTMFVSITEDAPDAVVVGFAAEGSAELRGSEPLRVAGV